MSSEADLPWFILRTKSRQENIVEGCLKEKLITAYLPRRKTVRVRRDRRILLDLPLFPGYIFVQPKPNQFHDLSYVPGSCGLLILGNQPAKMPARDLESVRIVVLSGERVDVNSELIPGKKVEVLSGPFAGVKGELVKIKNQEKLLINAPVLGKSVNVEINSANIHVL
ncbi:transcriptional antiterminator RfaH [Alteromonadaceae bacterium 2753L.S.0a.02]|nr:transcriptional antiterminator RfaH [Alteromonadaceae bacterium 2753L.S.0a.02]